AAPPTLSLFGRINMMALVGHPFVRLEDTPGIACVAVVLGVLALALAAAVSRAVRTRGREIRVSSPVTLIALLTVATPLRIGLLSFRPHMSFMLTRNLSPSLIP